MHLVVPFAVPLSEPGRQTLQGLDLPNLTALLAHRPAPQVDSDEASSFSPPHERVLARLQGWRHGDGMAPWAAQLAAADGLDSRQGSWGLMTPVHWHVDSSQVTLLDPELLQLDAAGSLALLEAVRELVVGAGFGLDWGAPLRWYLQHDCLANRASASLDRVIGRNVDNWRSPGAEERPLRRLQNEVQMLLHDHPINQEREQRGLLPVNSFWLSGCGSHQAAAVPAALQLDQRLRGPALASDWFAWQAAWLALDAGPLAALRASPERAQLTLCGERGAATWSLAPAPWWRRWQAPRAVWPLLEAL